MGKIIYFTEIFSKSFFFFKFFEQRDIAHLSVYSFIYLYNRVDSVQDI